MTYQPRTDTGKSLTAGAEKVLGLVPKAASENQQWVADKTGSPTLGKVAGAGTLGAGMILENEIPGMARMGGKYALKLPGVQPFYTMASDMLPGGSTRAATRVMQGAAGSPQASQAAADAIATYQKAKAALDPNGLPAQFQPTTAQIAGNEGLAGLDRTLRNQPQLATAFGERDRLNQGNVNDILEGISGTSTQRLRAQTARDLKAEELYKQATTNPVTQHPLPTGDGMPPTGSTMPVPDGTDLGLNAYGTKLNELMQRPAMQQALAKARELSHNEGVKLSDQNAIQTLHWVKKALDDKIAAAGPSGLGPTEQRILLGVKNDLLDVMDGISPEYQTARQAYQAMSDPINRMTLGEYLRQKYMSALADAGGTGTRPSMFADALRNEDTPSIATGFDGATWGNTLRPGDAENLQAAAQQLGRQNFAQNAGRGAGSPTAQNLTGQRALDNIGEFNTEDIGSKTAQLAAAWLHPGAFVASKLLGSGARRAAVNKLGDAALQPELARKYLEVKPPYEPFPDSVTLPGAVGATEGADDNHMADGGQPQYKKSSFWDLLKEGWRQITEPDDAPQPQQQQPPGNTASGPVGKDFDSYVNRNVDAMSQ
jgi:hypothetical protein